MNTIVTGVLRAPKLILACWLALVVAAGALALNLDGALSGGGFTNPRAEALLTQHAIEGAFGDAPNQIAVVLDAETTLPAGLLGRAADALTAAGAVSVADPRERPDWRAADGSAALLLAGFSGENTAAQNLVPELQRQLSALAGEEASAFVTGQAALDYQLNAHSKADATRAELIVFPLLIIILLLVFRSVVATALPLLMAGSALAIASGIGYLATRVTDISNLYANIVSMIGIAVAVDYSLFIIKRFREELGSGAPVSAAVRTTMLTAGRSVLFSGVAVVLGLAALLIPRVMAFTSIALGGIIVTLAALLASTTALPAALLLLGPRIDRGRLPWPRAALPRPAAAPGRPSRLAGRPRPVGAAGILAMLLAATPLLGISLQSPVASATILPAGDPARTGLEVIDAKIGQQGLFPLQVLLLLPGPLGDDAALAQVERAHAELEGIAGVAAVTSVADVALPRDQLLAALGGPQPPRELSQLWTDDGPDRLARLLVDTSEGPDSVRAHEIVGEVRAQLPSALDGTVTVAVSGATAQGLDFDRTLIGALPLIAALVFLLTFVMLTVAFRSLILPGLALLFNTLVVVTSLGLLTLIQGLLSPDPLNSVTPILLFAVMFGLSMDYMVIIISRMSEGHRAGLSAEEAITAGVAKTRTMITSAALIMITVFLAFMTGQISIVREIGLGLAIAVALDALVIRSVIMPAVLRTLGERAFAGGGAPVPAASRGEPGDDPDDDPELRRSPTEERTPEAPAPLGAARAVAYHDRT